MKKAIILLMAGLILPIISESSSAAMRCGSGLISMGDHQAEVISLCGLPAYQKTKRIYRSGIPRRGAYTLHNSLINRELLRHDKSVIEVSVDMWVYNFGRRLFMQEVIFEDGRVSNIRSLGYGH